MKKHLCILLFLLFGIAAIAAEPLVLNEDGAVSLALKQNYDLKASLLDLKKAEYQNDNSWNVMLPDFSIEGSANSTSGIVDSSVDDEFSLSGSLEASVTLNKYDRYYMEYDELTYEAQALMYASDEEELKADVKKAYYYLIANKQSLDLTELNLNLAKKRWEQMEVEYSNGLVSELEVLEAQSTYENLKPDYTTANTEYKTEMMSFKSLLGIDLDQEVELDGTLDVEILELDDDSLISSFLAKRLDVESAQKSTEVEQSLLNIEKATDISPSLSLSFDYSLSNSDLFDSDWSDSASITATLSIPLNSYIKGSEEDVAISDAKKSVEQSQLNYKSVVEEAKKEIKTLVLEIQGYQENMEICKTAIEISQKTYDATERAYELGTTELLNLEDAQNTLFSAKQDLLTSQYNYLSAILDLESALNASTDEIKAAIQI
jgi:outer membrane protein TolC